MHGNMQPIRAPIICSETSIYISPGISNKLNLPHEQAVTSTLALNCQMMVSAKMNCKASPLLQYYKHHKLVHKLDIIFLQINKSHVHLDLPRFKTRHIDIDLGKWQLIALGKPNGPQIVQITGGDHARPLPECCEGNKLISLPLIYNYWMLPHAIISQPLGMWSWHSQYKFDNVMTYWKHSRKASWKGKETSWCWMCTYMEQR